MIPSNHKLLLAVRRAAASVAAGAETAEQQATLGAIDAALNELLLRGDPSFRIAYYADGLALLDEAVGSLALGDPALASRAKVLPRSIDPATSPDRIGELVEDLLSCLESAVDSAGAPEDAERRNWLSRVTRWQIRLYAHQLDPAGPEPDAAPPSRLTRDGFETYVRERFLGRRGLRVTAFEPLHGGFQKETILFTLEDEDGREDLVIRAQQPTDIMRLEGGTIAQEFLTLRIAHQAGVPVPEPLWLEDDPEPLGTRFLVSRKAAGRNFGTVMAASETLDPSLLRNLVTELAKIHSIRLDPGGELVRRSHLAHWLGFPTIEKNTRRHVEYWFELADAGPRTASPLVRRTLHWLRANVPACEDEPVFLHGDYGLHNILIEDGRVSAILDWEASRVGDPADDLAWFLKASEAFMPRAELLELYRAAGGRSITEERIRFHDVLTCLKMAVVCNVALARLEEAGDNVNLALIGLRFHHPFTSPLETLIESAETARRS